MAFPPKSTSSSSSSGSESEDGSSSSPSMSGSDSDASDSKMKGGKPNPLRKWAASMADGEAGSDGSESY